jgi:hypothetical protein
MDRGIRVEKNPGFQVRNVYVLDVWFEKKVKRECKGSAGMVRYADDFVCTFQYKQDAEKFMVDLVERLKKFNLEVAPNKTRTGIWKVRSRKQSETRRRQARNIQFSWVYGVLQPNDEWQI